MVIIIPVFVGLLLSFLFIHPYPYPYITLMSAQQSIVLYCQLK